MFCKKCGAQLDEDAQFCEKCGTVIKRIVPEVVQQEDEAAADQDEDVKESESVLTDDKEPEQKVTTAGASEDNSGSEQSAEKKQNKPLIITAIITAAVIIAALCFFLKPSGEVTLADPTAQVNFNNYGKMAFDESSLYFVGKSDSKDEETYVYATSYSGTDKRILSENDEISMISVVALLV